MVNQETVQAARDQLARVLTELKFSTDQITIIGQLCDTVLWQIVPLENLSAYLTKRAGLDDSQVSSLMDKIQESVRPKWEKVWEELNEHNKVMNKLDLSDRFDEQSKSLAIEVEVRRSDLDGQISIAPLLQQSFENEERWDIIAILDYLAQKNKFITTVSQIRDLREGFNQWLVGALQDRGHIGSLTPPMGDKWPAALVALLIQYLLEVRLYFKGEDAALLASIISQHLATATGDHSYATIVYGNDEKNEFVWRQVRVEGGQIKFAD